MKVHLYMKSGSVIKLDVEEMKWTRNGEVITKLNWTTRKGQRLNFIDVTQIEAIVEL